MTIEASIGHAGSAGAPRPLLGRLHDRRILMLSLFDQALVSGFGFAVAVATARVIGLEEFGRFALAMGLSSFATVLHDALFAAPMMSFAGRRRDRARAYFSAVMTMATVLAVAGGIVVMAGLMLLFVLRDGDAPWSFAAMAGLCAAAQCMQITARRVSFAQANGVGAAVMDLARAVIFAGMVAALLSAGHALNAASVLGILGVSSLLVTIALTARLRLAPATRRMFRIAAGMHWSVARWLAVTPLVGLVQDMGIWAFAGAAFGDGAVGGLRASQYLFAPIATLAMALENRLPLRATTEWTQGGVPALRRYLLGIFVPIGLANAAVILAFAIPARFWLNLIFGPAYADYAMLAQVLALGVAVGSVRNLLTLYFRAVQDTRVVLVSACFAVIATLVLIMPLTSLFGPVGLGLTISAANVAAALFLVFAAVSHYRRGTRG